MKTIIVLLALSLSGTSVLACGTGNGKHMEAKKAKKRVEALLKNSTPARKSTQGVRSTKS